MGIICPLCLKSDHKLYKYEETILIACPEAPDGMPISLEKIEQLLTEKLKDLANKLWGDYYADKEQ